ncbi:g1203 [Coccomyxa elongata]
MAEETTDGLVCPTCQESFATRQSLGKHLNRKHKCTPKGQPKYYCEPCKKQFERKDVLTQHFKSTAHKDAVKALAAVVDASTDNSSNANHCDNSTHTHNTTNITNNDNRITNNYTLANPPPRPRMFGRTDVLHIADITFEELNKHLNVKNGTGMSPFLNMFKLMHLNDKAPRNHNVLLESKDSDYGLMYKQRHWRIVDDPERMVMDCLSMTATLFLDVEDLLRENLDGITYRKFSKLRDQVERETSGFYRKPSVEVLKLLDRIRDAIVQFTARRTDLLAYAKADLEVAPPMEAVPKTREHPMWQPGGDRYEAFRESRDTGEEPSMPPEHM